MDIAHPKVVAYITHADQLLVFRHSQHPEAGIQVPAGSIEPGEDPAAAIIREAFEETGLEQLQLNRYLGEADHLFTHEGQKFIQKRHFYHLIYHDPARERWHYHEQDPADDSGRRIEFELFWVQLPDEVPELAGAQGILLERLPNDSEGPVISLQ